MVAVKETYCKWASLKNPRDQANMKYKAAKISGHNTFELFTCYTLKFHWLVVYIRAAACEYNMMRVSFCYKTKTVLEPKNTIKREINAWKIIESPSNRSKTTRFELVHFSMWSYSLLGTVEVLWVGEWKIDFFSSFTLANLSNINPKFKKRPLIFFRILFKSIH